MSTPERISTRVRTIDCDLAIIGGGLAGLCAAIAAARQGVDTVLVQDRPVFGGNSSSEIRVVPAGAATANAWAGETGLVHEILLTDRATNYESLGEHGMINSHYDLVLDEFVRQQDKLIALRSTSVRAAILDETNPRRITAVRAAQLASEADFMITARQFVDATGDGTVAALANADFRYGREARVEFGEHLAPIAADSSTLGSTITMKARNTGLEAPYRPPDWVADYRTPEDLGVDRHVQVGEDTFGGYWWLEVSDPFHQIEDNAEIREELHRHVLGVWNYLKNHSPHRDRLRRFALEWIGQIPGKRESRRVLGDVIITEHDVREDRRWSDAIGYAGWWIDLHVPGGVNRRAEPAERENIDEHYRAFVRVAPFSVPLRAHLSRSLDNLWLAGRCVSATHVGLGPIRVQITLGALGQAVGIAAARSILAGCTPHAYADPAGGRLAELQQELLRNDVRLLGVANTDPDDQARRATVTASSSASLLLDSTDALEWLTLGGGRGQILPMTTPRLDALALRLCNPGTEVVHLNVGLEPIGTIWQREPGTPLWTTTIELPASFEDWLDMPVGVDLPTAGSYRLTLQGAASLQWAACTDATAGCVAQRYVSSPGKPMRPNRGFASLSLAEVDLPAFTSWQEQRHRVHLLRASPEQRPYGPDNVINGLAWPYAGPNLWRSDPAERLPQWLRLSWPEPVRVGRVQVSFDTDLTSPVGSRPGMHRAPQCVRDWRILGLVNDRWMELYREQDNYVRHRVARFAPRAISALMIEITATNGSSSVHVYELRAYAE